jgi:hypothetical protein
MREILEKIMAEQREAREKAAADGCVPAAVYQVGVEAGEEVVVEHLKEIEETVVVEHLKEIGETVVKLPTETVT